MNATPALTLIIMDFEELEEGDENKRKVAVHHLEELAEHLRNQGSPPDVASALEDAGYRHVL